MLFEERFGQAFVTCLSNNGIRPGELTPGRTYKILVDDVYLVYIKGDNGTEYEWDVVKNLFTEPVGLKEWRDKQLNKILNEERRDK